MAHQAYRDKQYGGYYYRGFYLHKPEGSRFWNIRKIEDGEIDWCFTEGICNSFAEAKSTVDYILENGG